MKIALWTYDPDVMMVWSTKKRFINYDGRAHDWPVMVRRRHYKGAIAPWGTLSPGGIRSLVLTIKARPTQPPRSDSEGV